MVLVHFSLVKTKIVHYSSLCYSPLTYLAALQLERIWVRNEAFGWSRFALGILGNIIALVVIAVPFIGMDWLPTLTALVVLHILFTFRVIAMPRHFGNAVGNKVDHVDPSNALLLEQKHGLAFLFAENRN